MTSVLPSRKAVTASSGNFTTATVTFSSAMASTSYSVALTSTDTSAILRSGGSASGCILTVDSRTTGGFTFSCRFANDGTAQNLDNSHTFDYIAIPTN